MVESKGVALSLVIVSFVLTGLVPPGLSDAATSVAYAGTADSAITATYTEPGNPAASATITVTIYAVDDE